MTANDKEIDVLLRRYAKGVAQPNAIDHLDADELNSFAEGSLPALARQRYVAHLADCDDCRKLASQLAVATGAAAEARVPASQPAESWWKKLSILLAPATLRYAAFAVVLLGVVGIAFIVWRRPAERNSELIAQSKPEAGTDKPTALARDSIAQERAETTTTATPKATIAPSFDQKTADGADATAATAPPPPPAKPADTFTEKEAPAVAAKVPEAPRADASPAYAPAPAGTFGADNRAREQQNVGNLRGGPRRNENFDKGKVDNLRAGELAKTKDDEDRSLAANQRVATENKVADQPPAKVASVVAPSRGRDTQERDGASKREAAEATSEEAPETRSVGGRKFKRQGNAWVDAKFKSSMSIRNIARGSEEFDKLDSGLRSVAQQLGGEIVVVWKGKAYRIK